MKGIKLTSLISLLFIMTICGFVMAQDKSKDISVSKGRIVSIDYTLYVDRKVFETTKDSRPLTYVQGSGQLLKGFEEALFGMTVGQKKTIEIKPEDAYGSVRKDFIVEMPIEKLPAESLKVGETLSITGNQGRPVYCKIRAIKGKKALLDFNHPLAGKKLKYNIEVVDIQDKRESG